MKEWSSVLHTRRMRLGHTAPEPTQIRTSTNTVRPSYGPVTPAIYSTTALVWTIV